jgi:hypothetical protein
MARPSRARIIRPDADQVPDERADLTPAIANVWTLSTRATEEVVGELKGESTEPPTPALRALFRADRR